MNKRPNIAKTTYSGGLTGTSNWSDYTNSDPIDDIRKAIKSLKESDERRRQAEREHWSREGVTEAFTEISKAIAYYLDTGDMRAYYILEICRMSMQYNGCPVSRAMAEEGRRLLD